MIRSQITSHTLYGVVAPERRDTATGLLASQKLKGSNLATAHFENVKLVS